MIDRSLITTYLVKWVINPLAWLLLILGFLFGVIAILYIKKRRALKYNGFEITDYGINTGIKCGWFGSRWYAKGLWTTGSERMFTSDGEEILNFSEEDFIEINNKRGVPFVRDPVTRRLFPAQLSLTDKSREIMAEVPPRSFVDAAVDAYDQSVKETTDWKDKAIQFAAWALIIIFALVSIIVIVQYVKQAQADAGELYTMAGSAGLENCKEMCREAVNIAVNKVAGGAP